MFIGSAISLNAMMLGTRFTPASLFSAGEQGAWFDPSDLATMFQDRAGSIPVTAPAQPVGLRLDKSQGLAVGPELVVNGDFSGGSTGWTAQAGWTIGSGVASVDSSVAGGTYLRTSGFSAVAGAYYRVTFTVTSRTSGSISAAAGTAVSLLIATAVGTYSFLVQASGVGGVGVFAAGPTTIATIDNISVKELPGNHAVAPNDPARGVYGIEPAGGTRNLLIYSQQFENAAWGARWGGAATITPNDPTFLAPDGTQTVDKVTATLGGSGVGQAVTLTSGVTYTFSCWINSPVSATDLRIATLAVGGGQVAIIVIPASSSLTRASITYTPTVTQTYYIGVGNSVALQTVYVWGAQLETGSSATAYQQVVSQYEVTEAGVATVQYVQYDGLVSGYVTPTINPGIDKVQTFTGLRKLSDAALGCVMELSSTVGANNGAFNVFAPRAVQPGYSFGSKGTATSEAIVTSGFAAPITNVITGIGDISGDVARLRVNAVQVAADTTTDQGTGNYLAYPLYLGRRGGTTLPFNGRDYGIIVRFGSTLTATTISNTEAWMGVKTGFAAPVISGAPTIGVS